jgi:hypothetical protein
MTHKELKMIAELVEAGKMIMREEGNQDLIKNFDGFSRVVSFEIDALSLVPIKDDHRVPDGSILSPSPRGQDRWLESRSISARSP